MRGGLIHEFLLDSLKRSADDIGLANSTQLRVNDGYIDLVINTPCGLIAVEAEVSSTRRIGSDFEKGQMANATEIWVLVTDAQFARRAKRYIKSHQLDDTETRILVLTLPAALTRLRELSCH